MDNLKVFTWLGSYVYLDPVLNIIILTPSRTYVTKASRTLNVTNILKRYSSLW